MVPPCDHKKSYISVNLDPKTAWNYAHLARKIHIFSRQGGAPCNPDRGASPLVIRKRLVQALGLLALLAFAWTPHVENPPKPMLHIFKGLQLDTFSP